MEENIIEINLEPQKPSHPFIAGIWLITGVMLTLLIAFVTLSFIPHQKTREPVLLFFIAIGVGWTIYMWTQELLGRSGLKPTKAAGILAAVFFFLMIASGLIGYDLIFGNIMKVLNIIQTERGTHAEFYVIFVTWTGMVTGGTGFGLGLALKDYKLAFKLLFSGLAAGAITFYSIAITMEALGYRVGTARADGQPSMPIVTILGIFSAALLGSAVFGKVLARSAADPGWDV